MNTKSQSTSLPSKRKKYDTKLRVPNYTSRENLCKWFNKKSKNNTKHLRAEGGKCFACIPEHVSILSCIQKQ
jgi:hypothetical protein